MRFLRKHDPLTRLVRDYERIKFLQAKKNSDLRSLSLEMRDQISQLDQTAKSLSTEQEKMKADMREIDDKLSAIHKSRGWIILRELINYECKSFLPEAAGKMLI